VVTVSGIDTFIIGMPSKAQNPIADTSDGITVFLHPAISVFVCVSIIALQLSLESYTGLFSSTVIESKKLQYLNGYPLFISDSTFLTEAGIIKLVIPVF